LSKQSDHEEVLKEKIQGRGTSNLRPKMREQAAYLLSDGVDFGEGDRLQALSYQSLST